MFLVVPYPPHRNISQPLFSKALIKIWTTLAFGEAWFFLVFGRFGFDGNVPRGNSKSLVPMPGVVHVFIGVFLLSEAIYFGNKIIDCFWLSTGYPQNGGWGRLTDALIIFNMWISGKKWEKVANLLILTF